MTITAPTMALAHRLEATMPPPTIVLTCRAPHADPTKDGQPCGAPLGHVHAPVEFITTASRMPERPDGTIWLRCPRASCRRWNRFRLLTAVAA